MRRHELSDEQWTKIRRLIPIRTGPKSKRGDRDFVNAVMWRLKTGAPWRDVPERYGPWKTVYNRFARWASRGVWERMFKALQLEVDEVGSLIDGSVVRAHQDAAGGKGGSDSTPWAVLEAVFRPSFTRSQQQEANRCTSRSRLATSTTRPKRRS